jgi:hypothetical protein
MVSKIHRVKCDQCKKESEAHYYLKEIPMRPIKKIIAYPMLITYIGVMIVIGLPLWILNIKSYSLWNHFNKVTDTLIDWADQ